MWCSGGGGVFLFFLYFQRGPASPIRRRNGESRASEREGGGVSETEIGMEVGIYLRRRCGPSSTTKPMGPLFGSLEPMPSPCAAHR